jgi:membrane protease YdiL (CAAX protease family)
MNAAGIASRRDFIVVRPGRPPEGVRMASEALSSQPPTPDDHGDAPIPLTTMDSSGDIPLVLSADNVETEDIVEVLPAPQRPHPGFWMSLLWCIAFLAVTQTPGSVVALAEMTIGMRDFARQEQAKQEELEKERAKQEALENGDPLNEEPDATSEPKRPKPVVLNPKMYMQDFLRSSLVRVSLLHAFAITEICVIFFSWGAIRLMVGADWKRKLALRRPGLAHTIFAVLGLPALALLGNGTYVFLTKVCGIPGMEMLFQQLPGMGEVNVPFIQELMDTIKSWNPAIAILIIGLGPGIGEELWCRGFLGRGLVGRYGVVVGIALTSFFFGLIHLDPAQATMAMLMGVCLHYVYQTTRSLWLSILLHFMNNSLSVVLMRFPALDAIDNHPERFLPLVAASAVLVAAIGYAFYQSRARLAPETARTKFLWRPDYPGVEYPPPRSGTVVVHPMPSALAFAGVAVGLILFLISCVLAYQQLQPA